MNKLNYEWLFLSLVASLPLYLLRFKIFGFPFTFLELFFLIVCAVWLNKKIRAVRMFQGKNQITGYRAYLRERLKYPFGAGIVLLASAGLIGAITAGFSLEALGIYKAYFIEAFLFFILVFSYLIGEYAAVSTHHQDRELNLILALSVSALAISLYAIYQKVTGQMWYGDESRITSFYPYPNAIGLYLGPLVVIQYFLLMSKIYAAKEIFEKQKLRLSVIFISFFLSIIAIWLAKSDGALIGVSAAIFFGSLFINKRMAAMTILVGAFIGGIIIFTPQIKKDIVNKLFFSDFSGEVRKQQWQETWQAFKNGKIISGCGLSGYQKCVQPYHQAGIFFNKDNDPKFQNELVWGLPEYKINHWFPVEIYMYPHNFFLNFWSELSIVGLVAIMFLLFQYFRMGIILFIENRKLGYSNRASSKIFLVGLFSVMMEVLIHGMVDVPYFKNDLSFLWWLFFAIIAARYAYMPHKRKDQAA